MIRLTYGILVILPLAVFLFFFALSDWLYSINVSIGATVYYCLVASLTIYMSLSILPLIVRSAPYQTALTTPLQACISLIQASYLLFGSCSAPPGCMKPRKALNSSTGSM